MTAMIDENWDYPRETEEYVFFDELLINGLPPATADVEYQLTRGLDRPDSNKWLPITEQNSRKCFLLGPQTNSGRVKVWVRVAGMGEHTVIEAGFINIT